MSTVTEIDKAVDEIIQEHKLSFLPARNNFLVTNKKEMSYLRPSLNQMRRQKKARIMSNRHRIIKKTKKYKSNFQKLDRLIHINSTKIPACKFCGSTEQGERISSCKKRSYLKSLSVEYVLGSDQDGFTNFLQKMEYNTMFESSVSKPTNIIQSGENSKSRHFFVHRVWSQTLSVNVKTDINDIIFEFSYITKLGEIDKVKTQIHGRAFYSMLAGCNLKKGPIFLYDKSPYRSNNETFIGTHESRNNNWSHHQNQLLTQNNSLFGQ